MFDKIIAYSIKNKFVIGVLVFALIVWGLFSLKQIPIDAVPDITNNQVQIITITPTLATQEVEKFITTPVELALQSLQNIEEIRSISRFGLSVITVVFEEHVDIYLARQLVNERIQEAQSAIPEGLGTPEMAPISTGLGEIYQYVVRPEKGFEDKYTSSELRTMQDWIVKRQLTGIPGVAEVNSMGGYLKQYEIAVNPSLLKSMNISITDVYDALSKSNENTGGAYIEKNSSTYYIRSEGVAKSFEDLANVVINNDGETPILVKDIAHVKFGKAPRYGALTRNGEEVVGGKVMMFKGANSAAVTELIKERVEQVQKSLPEGVIIEPYLVRDKLVETAIGTVKTNLLEGGLIVIFVLVLMLGNLRASLIVASVIPLAMLFAIAMMNLLGISANLMSLGAIDFGLVVDGAVIIVESIVHRLKHRFGGRQLDQAEMDEEVLSSSMKIRSSAAFGEIIILMVYIPILALIGIEGKMFQPMAQTVMLAILGALILSLSYVPMMSSLFLSKKISEKITIADRIVGFLQRLYTPVLNLALRFKSIFVIATMILFIVSLIMFSRMGGEFIPTLEEGDLAMQQILPPGSSLSTSVEISKKIQKKLLEEFPEIEDAIANIGSAEIPTDPMPVEIADYVLVMKPKEEWTSASSRQELFKKIEHSLEDIPGIGYEFSQPIQLRFNELMTGSKADIAIKLYGEDMELMYAKAKEAEALITKIKGVGTVNVEQTIGMPQIIVSYKYDKLAQYGLHIKEVNQVIRAAFAGEKAGVIYEGEKRFDLVIRLDETYRTGISDVEKLYITLNNGTQVPLDAVAKVELVDAPMQVSRENTKRRIVVGVNVGDIDVETLVENIQSQLDAKIELPTGYYFTYGGQFENLKAAKARLAVALPLALALIFILLFFTFGSIPQAVLIYMAIPLSAIGGVWALLLRGMPFSISAGIGFIALFGVAVLNGIVLIGYFNQLKKEGMTNIRAIILEGTKVRLRPVIMTAAVASLGFLPMALSTSGGAEVQQPLATVVIGGLITATFLTLIILPILYSWLMQWQNRGNKGTLPIKEVMIILPFLFWTGGNLQAQQPEISLDSAINLAIENHPSMRSATLQIQQSQSLENLKYAPGLTNIDYQGNGLYTLNGQHVQQLGFVQNFPSPSITKANNAYQKTLSGQYNLAKKITASELKLQIQNLYLDLQQRKALSMLYKQLIEIYSEYYQKAKVRMDLGATNAIEPLTIQSQLNEYSLLAQQVNLEIIALEQQFQLLLNTEDNITSLGELEVLSFVSLDASNNLWVQEAKQNIQIEKAKIDLLKTEMKPSFNVGASLQYYVEGGLLSGLQAGIGIPIFNGHTKKKIAAQKIQVLVANAQVETKELLASQRLLSAQNAIEIYAEGIKFYREQLDVINPEIKRISELNYQAGEISYLELLNALNLLSNNSKSYLEQVLVHNKAVVLYQFISNQ